MTTKATTRTNQVATRVKVFAAAKKIEQSGEKPTIRRVQAEIGGGSNPTISGFLQEYRKRFNTQFHKDDQRRLNSAVNTICSVASANAEKSFAREKNKLERKLRKVENELSKSRQATAQLAKNSDETATELRRQVAVAHADRQEAINKAKTFEQRARRTTRAEEQVKEVQKQAAAAEERAIITQIELESANAEITRLKQQLARARMSGATNNVALAA